MSNNQGGLTLNGRDIIFERGVVMTGKPWEQIHGLTTITEPNITHNTEDFPSYDASSGTATAVVGVDSGEYQIGINYNPNLYPLHRTIKEDCIQCVEWPYRLIYSDTGEDHRFYARVSSWQNASPADGRKTAQFTLEILDTRPEHYGYITG